MSSRLEIRIPKEQKEELERIAKMTGASVSELIREYIARMAEIEKKMEMLEAARNADRALTDILVKHVLQPLLGKLIRYQERCHTYIGFDGSKLTFYESINCSKWGIQKDADGKYVIGTIRPHEVCNEYGRCWDEYLYFDKVSSLKELKEFLEYVSDYLGDRLSEELAQIKNVIKIQ